VVLEVIAVPAFFLLLLGPSAAPAFPELLAILALADVGLAVVGTLAAGLAVQTRARDLIGPLLTLPLLVPVVIAAARATSPLFSDPAGSVDAKWLGVLGLYDLVFVLLAYAVFDFLLED
jgi:heme exporter protein B